MTTGSTVNGPASGLISDSPQGAIVGVLNNDQNGINYPALHWGTDHYLNDLVNGGVGPWFNNINATPVSPAPNSVYGAVGIQRLQHNLAAVQAFRSNVEDAVTQTLHDLGEKYNYSIPVENPMLFKNTGSTPDNPLPSDAPVVPAGGSGEVHAGAGRPDRAHRPGVVRRPRDPVAGEHRRVRLEHQPAGGRRREPVPRLVPEQAGHLVPVRTGHDERQLPEPQLLRERPGPRARRLRRPHRGAHPWR